MCEIVRSGKKRQLRYCVYWSVHFHLDYFMADKADSSNEFKDLEPMTTLTVFLGSNFIKQ